MTNSYSTGADMIKQERHSQLYNKGYTPNHDLIYKSGELLKAASCYIDNGFAYRRNWFGRLRIQFAPRLWPWPAEFWKPSMGLDRKLDLAKAGALIAAEIDRLIEEEANNV